VNERCSGSRVALEITGQAAVVADPGERAFNNPALAEDDKAVQFIAFDYFELPGAGLGDCGRRFRSLISPITEDGLDKGACPYRKSNPHVLMVESTEDRSQLDTPVALNGPSIRRILP
jgi:hypothetical protein